MLLDKKGNVVMSVEQHNNSVRVDVAKTIGAKLSGTSICDDCITDRLNLSVRSQANVVTRELGRREKYDRAKTSCAQCGAFKTAIQIRK